MAIKKTPVYIEYSSGRFVDEFGSYITSAGATLQIEARQWTVICAQFYDITRDGGDITVANHALSDTSTYEIVGDNNFDDSDDLMFLASQSSTPFDEDDLASNMVNITGDWIDGGTADLSQGQVSFRVNSNTTKFIEVVGSTSELIKNLHVRIREYGTEVTNPSSICYGEFYGRNTVVSTVVPPQEPTNPYATVAQLALKVDSDFDSNYDAVSSINPNDLIVLNSASDGQVRCGTVSQLASGSVLFSALPDVNITTPSNGQSIKFNTSQNKFINEDTLSEAGTGISLAEDLTTGQLKTIVDGENTVATDNGNGTFQVDADLSGVVQSVVEGDGISIDNTDPNNPIISSTSQGADGSITTGVLWGLTATINTDTSKFDLAEGEIFVENYMTDPENPVINTYYYAGGTALDVTYLATNAYTQLYMYIDAETATLGQIGGSEGEVEDYKDKVKLQILIHQDKTSISTVGGGQQLAYNKINDLIKCSHAIGATLKGCEIISDGVADLAIVRRGGTATAIDINSVADKRNSASKTFATATPNLLYGYFTASETFSYESSYTTVIKPAQYNDLSTYTLEDVPDDKFTLQPIYFFPRTNTYGAQYGQVLYDSIAEAVTSLQEEVELAETLEDGVLVTVVIAKGNASSTEDQGEVLFAQTRRNSFYTGLSSVTIRPGFFDVDKSEFTWTDGTRTLDLDPISTEDSFKIMLYNGTIISKASMSWTITDVEGVHYLYIDSNGDEQVSVNPSREQIFNLLRTTIAVSFILWANGSTDQAVLVTDIRKRSTGMSPDTTAKNFFDNQIYGLDGVAVTNFPTNTTATVDTDAQFGFATDELLFADRQYNFESFSRGDTWRVIYLDGSNVRHIDKSGFAFLTGGDFSLGTVYPVYNNGGTPTSATPASSNAPKYVYYLMGLTNDIDPARRMVAVMGDGVYLSEEDATAALSTEVARAEGLSGIKQELRIVYAVLYLCDSDFTNTHKTLAYSIEKITTGSSSGGAISLPSGLTDGSNADSLHTHEIQALQASTDAINDPDQTIYHADGAGGVEGFVITGNDKIVGTNSSTGAIELKDNLMGTIATITDGITPVSNVDSLELSGSGVSLSSSTTSVVATITDSKIATVKFGETEVSDVSILEVAGTAVASLSSSTGHAVLTLIDSKIGTISDGTNDYSDISKVTFTNGTLTNNGDGTVDYEAPSSTGSSAEYMIVTYQTASGVNGGTPAGSTWTTYPINTTVYDGITGASRSGTTITLPAGTYELSDSGAFLRAGDGKVALYDVDSAEFELTGLSCTGGYTCPLYGIFTIATETDFEFRYFITSPTSTTGFGYATGDGTPETYGLFKIIKIG